MAETGRSSHTDGRSAGSGRPAADEHTRRPDEGGQWKRLTTVALGAVVGGLVAGVLAWLADVPRGASIIYLELAGTADRARLWLQLRPSDSEVSVPEIHHALVVDVLLIVSYVVALFVAAGFLGRRGFRVRQWRRAALSIRWLAVVAGGLDLLENVGIWIGTDNAGSSSGWLDPLWAGVAAVAWAKFALLAVAVAYVVLAACGYVVTPPWVRAALLEPDSTNVQVGPRAAVEPERVVVEGTPTAGPESTDLSPIRPARFGIAVSGGGIRSAALALGGLQELDRDPGGPSWSSAAKVTAVSGGAYISGGYSVARSSRLNSGPPSCRPEDPPREPPPATSWPPQPPPPCGNAWNDGEPETEFLIGHLGYLLAKNPTGNRDSRGSDVPGVIATVVLGLLFNAVMLLVPLWLLVQPLAWLSKSDVIACDGYGDSGCLTGKTVWPTTIWIVVSLLSVVVWVTAGWVRGAFAPGSRLFRATTWVYLHLRVAVLGLVGLTIVLAILLLGFPALVTATPGWLRGAARWAQPAAIIGALVAVTAVLRSLARPLTRFAPQLAGLLFIAVLVFLSAHWASTANFQHWDGEHLHDVRVAAGAGHSWWDRWLFEGWSWIGAFPNHAWLLSLLGWLVGYAALNPGWWSMAPFYRGKLRGAFATYRRNGTTHAYSSGNLPTSTAEPSLYELDKRGPGVDEWGSPLQICATATVSGRAVKTHYGIPGLSVTFDPTTVRLNIPTDDEGGWSAYQCSTTKFERLLYRRGGSRFTTMMAVGISGAAVSPAMGKFKIGPARALIALLNVRLGVWVPNPKYVAAWRPDEPEPRTRPARAQRVPYPQPRLGYLLKEAFGTHDPDDLYLYVTDGGHWENTGLVELLRDRNFSEVVCLDADAGERDTVTQLANAVVLAELECGASISVDLDPLRSALGARRGGDYSKRSVVLGLIRRGDRRGLLWYAKPALTIGTPPGILSYGENDTAFPTTSTADQFFHSAKFSAYRNLGRYNARQVILARTAVLTALDAAPTWSAFETLAARPEAHWALATLHDLVAGEYEYGQLRAQLIEA